MTKVLSEEKIAKLLKEKKVSLESYRKSSSPPDKNDEQTSEDKTLQMISRQTLAIEKLSVLLHQNLVAILQKTSMDGNLLVEKLGAIFKGHSESLEAMLSSNDKSAKSRIKWRFKIHRDDRGRAESIEAEPENNE